MPVFIELTTDAFEQNFRRQLSGTQGSDEGGDVVRSARAGAASVRRPVRGIEIKEDTYAILKVIQANGQELKLFDSSSASGRSTSYTNFILQQVQEARMEKNQIVQTFGDNYIFFFGEDPRFLDCSCIILNTHDFNWKAEWWANYNTYLRGTKLAELGARLYMFYDDIIVEGYMMNAQAVETSQTPYHVQLQFKLFITNYQNISLIGNPNFPVRSSAFIPDGVVLTRGDAGADLTAIFRGEALDAAKAANATQETEAAQASGATATEDPPGTLVNESFSFPEKTGAGKTSENPLASGSRITKILRSVPTSFAVSQGWWDFITTNATYAEKFDLKKIIQRSHNPIRSKFADNWDEFIGGPDTAGSEALSSFGINSDDTPTSSIKGTVISQLEADDLFRETIQFLSCFGADANNPGAMASMGLSAGFGVNGAGFGAEAHASASIFGASASSSIGITDNFEQFGKDPLSAIYGAINQGPNNLNQNRNKYTQGAGDPLYGYPSDFAEGPGFGQAGFGDLGGLGFGSALGESGDPGFKDPNKFTSAGVSNNQGAFDRFMKPKEDSSALTVGVSVGVSAGLGGVSAGAAASVGGKPTAFAIVSVPGLLDENGAARQKAEAIATKQAQQKFGFASADPFGVNCASGGGGGIGFEKKFTLP